ncbi:putative Ubiquitin carboxyl-terminal hydrolase 47 [Blattamonas nauphoetae]|uniref:Ubiquitin carboxyl-terminal hydrolase 47 n=1 Tax=Blattamonas nauphoetae TaxID=2049346 RepID=A0ABQ9Y725_9EUKA|nr:putative Ubiquitin carboxyl-terminal hydrolase 47 [Blattamonas nauphoetae]
MNYMRTLDILSMSRSDLTKMKFGDSGEDGWSDGNENGSGMGKGADVSVSNEISGIGSHSTNDVLPTLGKDEEGWSGGGTGPKVFSERTVQFVVPTHSEEARMASADVGRLKPEFAVLPNVFSQSSPEMGQNALGTEISKSTSMSEPLLDVGMRTTRDAAEELPPAPSILTTPPTTMSNGPSADESSPRFAGKVPQKALPMTFGFPPSTPFLHWNKLEAEEVSDRVKRVRAMEGHASLPRDDPPGVSLSFLTDKDGDRDRDGDGVGMGRGRRIGRSGKEKGEKRGESEGQVVSFTKFEFEKEDEEAVNELMKMSGFRRERCRVALRASGNSIGLGREWLEKKKGVSLVDLVVSSQEECGRRIEVDVARSERRLKRQQRKENRSRSSRRTRPAPIVPRVPLSELSRELESLLTELEEGTPQPNSTARVQFSTNRRIVFELQRLFATLLSSQNEATTTTGLTESFGWTTRDAGSQQDILELNHLLLEALEVKLKGTGLSELVDSTFGGWQSNRVKCSECGSESENAEAFRDLSVPLLSSSADVVGERSTLEACLSSMMGGEELIGENQYFCSECSSKMDAHRYSVLSSVPPLLTLALMRFRYDWGRVRCSSYYHSISLFADYLLKYKDGDETTKLNTALLAHSSILSEDGDIHEICAAAMSSGLLDEFCSTLANPCSDKLFVAVSSVVSLVVSGANLPLRGQVSSLLPSLVNLVSKSSSKVVESASRVVGHLCRVSMSGGDVEGVLNSGVVEELCKQSSMIVSCGDGIGSGHGLEVLKSLDSLCIGLKSFLRNEDKEKQSWNSRSRAALSEIEWTLREMIVEIGKEEEREGEDERRREISEKIGGMLIRHFPESFGGRREKKEGVIGIDIGRLRMEMEENEKRREHERQTEKAEEERRKDELKRLTELRRLEQEHQKQTEEMFRKREADLRQQYEARIAELEGRVSGFGPSQQHGALFPLHPRPKTDLSSGFGTKNAPSGFTVNNPFLGSP